VKKRWTVVKKWSIGSAARDDERMDSQSDTGGRISEPKNLTVRKQQSKRLNSQFNDEAGDELTGNSLDHRRTKNARFDGTETGAQRFVCGSQVEWIVPANIFCAFFDSRSDGIGFVLFW